MQTQRRISSHSYQKQRGVTTLLAVLMMLSLFTFLAVVTDTGRLYLEKRTLQKNADLAALETALLYCRDQTLDVEAMTLEDMNVLSAQRNNFLGNDANSTVTVTRNGNAITVALSYKVPASLFEQLLPSDDNEVNLTATATAKACEPIAQLAMRSKLAEIDSNQSLLLNPILGGLLGTTLNLSAADWNGVLDTNINLLSYLDALGAELNLDAGDYNGVLTTDISLTDLIEVSAEVLNNSGDTASVTAFNTIAAAIPGFTPLIKLGDILNLQTGADEAALDADINLFNLIQGSIQLASDGNATAVDLPVNLPGLASVSVQAKIIEPQQQSPIGNPETDEIYVRSAQVRTLVSVDLSETAQIVNVLTGVIAPFIGPVAELLDDVVSGNVFGAVGNLLENVFNGLATLACGGFLQPECPKQKIAYLEILAEPLQINIDAGGGEISTSPNQANLPVYICAGETKELTAIVKTSLQSARIGKIDNADAFSSDAPPATTPYSIIEIGYKIARPSSCIIGICSNLKWATNEAGTNFNTSDESSAYEHVQGGLQLSADTELVGANLNTSFQNPNLPELGDPCIGENPGCYQPIPIGERELGGIDLNIEAYGTLASGNLSLLTGLIDGLLDALLANDGLIAGIVNALIDPNTGVPLLDILGADLAGAEVGAALTCENDKVRLTN